MRNEKLALAACRVAHALWGLPYRWGGQGVLRDGGLDCSGSIVEVLKAVGVLSEKDDLTASGMAAKWPKVENPMPGTIACWSDSTGTKITHVTFVLEDALLTLDAAGGGSSTNDLKSAQVADAYLKYRTVAATARRRGQKGPQCIVDPFAG